MSQTIHFRQFDEEKVDQAWKEIVDGSFLVKLEKELDELGDGEESKRKRSDISEMMIIIQGITQAGSEALANFSFNVTHLDSMLIEYYLHDSYYGKYSNYYSDTVEIFSALFFQVLGIDIDEEYGGDLNIIPEERWINLYKEIKKEHLAIIKEQMEGDFSYVMEVIKGVREVLKDSIDTGTKFIAYEQQDLILQEPFKSRFEKITQLLKKDR